MSDTTSRPRIACVMPFRNEARHLPSVLDSLAAQTVDKSRLYVVAVDNGSNDGGDVLVRDWLVATGVRGEVVRESAPSIPRALNVGLGRLNLREDLIVRLDAHTLYDPPYLQTIDDAFAQMPDDVWCVGGAPTPLERTDDYGIALGIALYSNPFGLGPADYRSRTVAVRDVSTVYLGAWRPGVFARVGVFDERWKANEDCELTERIRASDGRVVRVAVRPRRMVTRGAVATIKQWSRYGYWRAQTFRAYPAAVRPRHVVPPLALAAAPLFLARRLRAFAPLLFAIFAVGTFVARRPGESARVTLGSLVFFPLVHAGYGLGLVAGLLNPPPQLKGGRDRLSQ